MKKQLKITGILLSAILCLSACGSETQSETVSSEAAIAEETVQPEADAGEETQPEVDAVATSEETSEEAEMEAEEKKAATPEADAIAFVEKLKTGWNLGNTFDAVDYNGLSDELLYESCWCGAKTTKEMIDTIKAAGFETIRIPVSWHNHLVDDNHTISEAWLDRVQEVVDYAIANDMYVIINIHHDCSTQYCYPSSEYLEQSKQYMTHIWTQVAGRFKDYDEHLIMESMNEPRLVGDANEWWLDIQKENCIDSVKCINELNQNFVDVVRSSGGNNANRYLMVSGYCASYLGATNEYFEMPQDIAGNKNKILISVHAYIPYAFALQSQEESGSTAEFDVNNASQTQEIDYVMDLLNEMYVQKGIGVVIGEYGCRDKGGNTQARADCIAYYIKAARERGISCCIWDNNAFSGSGENFGLLNRSTLEFAYPEIIDSIMTNCE